jgi:hypothetical protein
LLAFGDAILPAPPIPLRLRNQLKRRRPWCWSTVPVDPMAMYLLEPAVSRRHVSAEYAAVSHAGHGLNSYGLNVYVVTESLAAFIQLSWGGVYSDREASHARIARAFVLLSELLDGAVNEDSKTRAALVYSDFRGVASLSRQPRATVLPNSPGDLELLANAAKSSQFVADLDRVFATAARTLCDSGELGPSLSRLLRTGNRSPH